MIKSVPTTYQGIAFRSRLEATWAAFFDAIGWKYAYEPCVVRGYTPDFVIFGGSPLYIEVGPCVTLNDYKVKSIKGWARIRALKEDFMVVGVDAVMHDFEWPGFHAAGWLIEGDVNAYGFGPSGGLWTRCIECSAIGVVHAEGNYIVRPCGHHPGGSQFPVDIEDIKVPWKLAKNAMQWRGSDWRLR